MKQLTPAQFKEIKQLLGLVGLDVKKVAKPKTDIWAKRHAARMARTWKSVREHGYWKDAVGITNYQVKGEDGKWYSELEPGFLDAKAYRRKADAELMSNHKS